jgi:hypothetical protein
MQNLIHRKATLAKMYNSRKKNATPSSSSDRSALLGPAPGAAVLFCGGHLCRASRLPAFRAQAAGNPSPRSEETFEECHQ